MSDSITELDSYPTDAAPGAKPRPAAGVWALLKPLLRPLASLQLTVVLFSLSLVLVFAGTLAQINNGVWTVVDDYFRSWGVWIPAQLFVQCAQIFFPVPRDFSIGLSFPFPGGWLLGTALLVNLLAAHAVRFRFTWNRAGVLILHSGLVVLMVGELLTGKFAVEQRMTINEGESANFTEETRNHELAFVDASDPAKYDVVVVPERRVRRGGRIEHPDLPVDVEVAEVMVNSALVEVGTMPRNLATAGTGLRTGVVKKPEVSGVDPVQKVDVPAAYVTLRKKGTGEDMGTYLVTAWLKPQKVTIDGKPYTVALQ